VRYLLLSPLYGYALRELTVDDDGSASSSITTAWRSRTPWAPSARASAPTCARSSSAWPGRSRAAPSTLTRFNEAEQAAQRGDHVRVLELLGAWPAPLAIFLRTPEGQTLSPDTRSLIARALGLLGSACVSLGEVGKGEEVLRLAVQYAGRQQRGGGRLQPSG
jgi:hypothetical protein